MRTLSSTSGGVDGVIGAAARYIRRRYDAGVTRDRVALSIIGGLSLVIVGLVGVLLLGPQPGLAWSAEVSALPALNAAFNASCAALLVAGWIAIRRRRIAVHRACMLAACVASALFLVSYVVYHALAGSRPFGGQGWMRAVYFPILVSHVVLAAAMVPFVLTTVYRALSGQFDRPVRIARRTLPVWLYVSVTGVLVYLLLYHLG